MKKIIVPGIAAGFVMLAVGMAISQLSYLVAPSLISQYENAALFRPWSDPLMSLYFLYPFILGMTLAWTWNKVKGLVKGKDFIKRGATFGFSFWAVASFAGIFMTYSCFPVSLEMITSWLFSSLIQVIIAGILYAKMNP